MKYIMTEYGNDVYSNKKVNFLKVIVLYCYGFLLFYNPRLEVYLPFTYQNVMFWIFLGNIFLNYKYIINSRIEKKIFLLYFGIIVSSLYYIFRTLIKGNPNINTNIMSIVLLTNLLFLMKYLKSIGYVSEKAVKFILNLSTLQSLIGIIMFINPSFRDIALKLYLTGSTRVELEWLTSYRIYGLTGDYTYITPIFHGMLGVIATVYAVWKDRSYLIYIPFLLFIILVNGRTGIVIMGIGIVVALSSMVINRLKIKRAIGYGICLSIVTVLVIKGMKIMSPETYKWIMLGIEETLQLVNKGSLEGNYSVLDKMWFFPDWIGVIFGEGHRVYGAEALLNGYKFGSDIGFINDIFMGGLIYIGILYFTYIKFFTIKIFDKSKMVNFKINKSISISFLIILLIANYKGECMRGTNLLLGMIFLKIVLLDEIKNLNSNSLATASKMHFRR